MLSFLMNYSYLNPSTSYPPTLTHPQTLIPNPNPNPNSIPIPDPSNADLPTTISLLKDLAALAETTIKSVSDFFSSSSSSSFLDSGFCRCPYDSRHLMPPETLFRHSLTCPSSPGAALIDLGFLETLRYPHTLKSESQIQKENLFVRSLPHEDADLCFSLDGELGDIGSNFFYKDCPGVVISPDQDASNKTFTLPRILSFECANFISGRDEGSRFLAEGSIRILPSEFWALRSEVEKWKDYPVSYSYTILRVALCLCGVGDCGLLKWVISNSPRYGVLIDVAMRDHIFLLLKLCLKAIWREALCSLKLLFSGDGFLDPKTLVLECPHLVGSLTWLASQLSVLYGETNGRFFAIGMIKESLLHAGSSSLVFKLGQDMVTEEASVNAMGDGVSDNGCEGESKVTENSELKKPSGNAGGGQVYVSQVAAAVAALHERSLLEERIKMFRFAPPLSKSQLIDQHFYASMRGDEERGRRPNYRAILEHDGLLWQRSHNQDMGKSKTREELLAEERDYKRRRMSYRGKKLKRNPTQVIHDIIEDHMEEIKQAGGIGCNVKVAADAVVSPLDSISRNGVTANVHEFKSSGYDPSETRSLHVYRRSPHAENNNTSSTEAVSNKDRSRMSWDLKNPQKKQRYEHSKHREDHKRNKDERDKAYGSRSPPSYRSCSQVHERYAHRKDQGDLEIIRSKYVYDKDDSGHHPSSKDHISRSTLTSNSAKGDCDYISGSRSRNRGRTSESRRSESVTQDSFEDRYDPSGSYDGYDTMYADVSPGSNYLRPENLYSPENNMKHHGELRRHDRSTKGRNRDNHK